MRPLRVTMEGFSTFLDPTEVDFTGVDLVALVGPTGSGKSSIIDAITFALYGSVSRYNDARLVAPVIHQRANEAKVRLDFEVGDRQYTAVRVVRRAKADRATTREARLEQITELDEDTSPVLASGAKELTEAVEALLGLDFTQFTKTVVLPQGDFAEFLTDDPASRQRLLRRLLDLEIYARMGVQAREDAKAAAQKAEVLESQMSRFGDLTPELLGVQRERLHRLQAFGVLVADRLSEVRSIENRLVELRAAVAAIDADLTRLVSIEIPADVADRGEVLAISRVELEQTRAQLAAVRRQRDDAHQVAAAAGEPAAIEARLAAVRRAGALAAEIDTLSGRRTVAAAALSDAQAAQSLAEVAAEEAAEVLRAARLGADAAAWTASLAVGSPCPVCRQTVVAIPDHDPSAELLAAETSAHAATASLKAAQTEAAEAASVLRTLTARLEDRLEEHRLVGPTNDSDEELERRLHEARTAVANVKAAEASVALAERSAVGAEQKVERAEAAERELRQRFSGQRDGVASLTPPAAEGHSLVGDWSALATWADRRREACQTERLEVAEEGKRVAAAKGEILEHLAEGGEPLGLPIDPEGLPEAVARAQATTEAEMARIADRLAELEGWRSEAGGLRAEQRVNEALGRQLAAGGFEGWLLSEALDDLVERASVRLQELSNGQYTLAAHDRVFRIVDHHNAGEQRDVRTLSGGETFLASLSLALALADSIRELAPVDAPRLGSMFLDEGFGTLDAETLDVVATTIEELSSSGRLVGIVTHIEALAERLPVRYQVTKGPSSSSVERVML